MNHSHQVKDIARNKLTAALSSGKIIRPANCLKCGSTKNIQGHHPDYNKPLEVIWLCLKCHKAEHVIINAGEIKIDNKTTAERLRQLRGNRTMREMGELCQTNRQSWNHWESGEHLIPVHKAKLLNVSLDWLYLGKGNPP